MVWSEACQLDGAGVQRSYAGDEAQEGRFPRAVPADDTDDFAGVDVEGDVLYGPALLV